MTPRPRWHPLRGYPAARSQGVPFSRRASDPVRPPRPGQAPGPSTTGMPMPIAARWRSWLRRAAVRSPAPCPRPAVEELERREVLSGFAALPDPETGANPGAEGHSRFIAAAGGPARGFEQAHLDATPAGALSFGRFDHPALSQDTPSFKAPGGGFRRVVPNATVIDAAWLAQHGPGPYLLDPAGATYVLQTDVRTEGTAFVVAAPDVTLDLNGHTVLYGDRPPPGLRNGGFEE